MEAPTLLLRSTVPHAAAGAAPEHPEPALSGDLPARIHGLAAVYREHKDAVLSVAFQLVGERHAAEDVLQDVFVALARRSEALPPPADLRAYLLRSCVNRVRDLRRRPHVVALDGAAVESAATPAALEGPDAHVARALRRLPAEQREVVTLHLHGDLRFREIAESLSLSVHTVTSRYRYALARLRRTLGAGDPS